MVVSSSGTVRWNSNVGALTVEHLNWNSDKGTLMVEQSW